MRSIIQIVGFCALIVSSLASSPAPAQCDTCCSTPYRLTCKTIYEDRQVTCYKPVCETVYDQVNVTRQVPVWETEARERRFTVLKPVQETSSREERFVVQRPVYETVMRDASYDQVRNITETAEREERYVTTRQVWETASREERYVVQRPVMETVQQQQIRTVMQPVTTCRTQFVDQGCYADQVSVIPGRPTFPTLQWLPATQTIDPVTGLVQVQRGGLSWVSGQTPATQVVQRVWKPNVVAQQIPVTQLVPQQIAENVPVQVCKYVAEEQVRQVPVQVCKTIQEEHCQKVPYTTCRQVVEHIARQVPEQVCHYVSEEHVRQVPVTVCKMVAEEHVEPYQVRVCRMVCSAGDGSGAARGDEASARHLQLSRAEDGGGPRAGLLRRLNHPFESRRLRCFVDIGPVDGETRGSWRLIVVSRLCSRRDRLAHDKVLANPGVT